ncbi:MAG: hypothetical protein RL216_1622 [Pseudomonadota bacterium]|jgi:hypothetical protein
MLRAWRRGLAAEFGYLGRDETAVFADFSAVSRRSIAAEMLRFSLRSKCFESEA